MNQEKRETMFRRIRERDCPDSVTLARTIARIAHEGQKRPDGSPYITHPENCRKRFLAFVKGLGERAEKAGIPIKGMEELCLLHDVLEDTPLPIEDLETLFAERGMDAYFRENIREPLLLITHDKSVDYVPYIGECLKDPRSALAKLIDLADNLNPLTLDTLDRDNLDRSSRYLGYAGRINDAYHFIEKRRHLREETAAVSKRKSH